MKEISDPRLSDILAPFGVKPDPALFLAMRAYIDLLFAWNRKISLTSIKNPEEIVRLHFGESFFANSALSISRGRLADVGSGAGFPGIPIKMLTSELDVSLIESNAKKAAFLSEVLRRVDLHPAEVLHSRAEDIPEDTPSFDFITARAVGDHERLLMWARRHIAASGRLILFLGADDASIASRQRDWLWNVIPIPNSKQRVLLVGSLR